MSEFISEFIFNKINVGATAPFDIVHVTDSHLTLADDRDDKRKIELSINRKRGFQNAEKYLIEAGEYAQKNGSVLCHTGDMIDFVSCANLDFAREYCEKYDPFFIAGNHEFSLYVGEAKEDAAYREKSLSLVQSAFKSDIRFCSRVVNGVDLVGIDDGYYNFEESQYEALKNEVKKGLPIILFIHNPIFEPELFKHAKSNGEVGIAYLTGAPAELIKDYPKDRFEQQKPDELTLEVCDYIRNCEAIKAVVAGHLHYDFESSFEGGKMQFVTGIGTLRKISVI
ncbi:MAG: metallophosphoesterase [Clostridiales bacterium]|nr:metallophosphoesterase [Clostridiales bacterium]